MTRILLILILWCPAVMAQFGVEQPFFLSSAAPFGPSTIQGLWHYWVASDLPDGSVNNWTDRIEGVVLKLAAGSLTKDSNGIYFDSTGYMTNIPYVTSTNYIMGSILKPWFPTEQASGQRWANWGDINGQYNYNFYDSSSTKGSVQWVVIPGDEANSDYVKPVDYLDLWFACSNAAAWYTYTNGINARSGTVSFPRTNIYVGYNATGNKYQGWIQELIVYTNVNNFNPYVSQMHTYSTNTYPLHSDTNDVEFITGQSFGTLTAGGSSRLGFWFIPWKNIVITALGRYITVGSSNIHTIYLKNAGGANLTTIDINMTNYSTGSYGYTNLASYITLTNRLRYMLEVEVSPTDPWYDDSIVTNDVLVGYIGGQANNEVTNPQTNHVYGIPNFKYHY